MAFEKAKESYDKLKDGSESLDSLFSSVRERISKHYHLPEGTAVFIMPSGSDAEYIPVLVAKALNEGKKITNIVTCNEEVGSGTLAAANGQFFSPVEPIPGHTDAPKKNGDDLAGLAEGVKAIPINAREASGDVVNSNSKLDELLAQIEKDGAVPIIHTVFGSKTGICEKFPKEQVEKVKSLNGLFVLDACQARFREHVIQDALQYDCCVLITGSKFFRGPPFSGAVLIPKHIVDKAKSTKTSLPHGLHTFIG